MTSFNMAFSRDKGEGHLRLWWTRARSGTPTWGPGHPEKLQGSWGQRPHLGSPSTGFLLCHRGWAAPPQEVPFFPRAYGKIPHNLPRSLASMRPQHLPGFLATGTCMVVGEHSFPGGPLSWLSVHKGLGQGWPWATRPDCSLSLCIQ